jgi:hypothetical protein
MGRWWSGYGYAGDPYCRRCGEVFQPLASNISVCEPYIRLLDRGLCGGLCERLRLLSSGLTGPPDPAEIELRLLRPPGMVTQGARGPPGPLGLAIASDSDPLPIEFAWDLMEVTYIWPPPLG